jgi:hypothetical protein
MALLLATLGLTGVLTYQAVDAALTGRAPSRYGSIRERSLIFEILWQRRNATARSKVNRLSLACAIVMPFASGSVAPALRRLAP